MLGTLAIWPSLVCLATATGIVLGHYSRSSLAPTLR